MSHFNEITKKINRENELYNDWYWTVETPNYVRIYTLKGFGITPIYWHELFFFYWENIRFKTWQLPSSNTKIWKHFRSIAIAELLNHFIWNCFVYPIRRHHHRKHFHKIYFVLVHNLHCDDEFAYLNRIDE